MRRARILVAIAAVCAVAAAVAIALPSYLAYLAITAVITAIISTSVGMLTGQAGLASLCQMSFCGIGAWCACWMNLHVPQAPFFIQIVAAPCVGVCVGLLIGLPALRLRGINLAAVTLAFAVACDAVFAKWGFPGNESNTGFTRPGWLIDDHQLLLFCVAVLMILAVALQFIGRRRVGMTWVAVAYSERAAAALGVSVARAKITAFGASAGIAAFAGALMAAQLGTLTGRSFEAMSSLAVFSLGVFAAAQYVEGAIVAGLMTVLVPEILRRAGLSLDLTEMLFGAGAVQALYRGAGIGGDLRSWTKELLAPVIPASSAADRTVPVLVPTLVQPRRPTRVLQITDLSVRYGEVVAVDQVRLDIHDGQIVALVGPNGAGKSTIIDALSGFLRDYQGEVLLNGSSIDTFAPHQRARLGLRRTFQQCRAIPELSAIEYLRLSAGRNVSYAEARDILRFFECATPEDRIGNIEIGLRRLVEVSAAVAARPRVLLLDEPAAGLSGEQSKRLAQQIAEIPARFGCALLLVEHDMDLVQSICSAVTVLDFGKVIAHGPPELILKQREVVEAYLGTLVA